MKKNKYNRKNNQRSRSSKSKASERAMSRNSTKSKGNLRKDDSVLFDKDVILGTIDGNPNGYAFLVRDDMGKDAFISPSRLACAIHGDRVKAVLRQRGNDDFEAMVVEVINPTHREILGTFIQGFGSNSYVIPNEKKISQDILIDDTDGLDVVSGDRVLITITSRRNAIFGVIKKVYKTEFEEDWDILSVLVSHNLSHEFDKKALKEVSSISDKVGEDTLEGREDFRNTSAITIDGEDSRDFDDAVYLTKNGGKYELVVHIADVSHYVTSGSALDKEAFRRGTSVYFPNSFIPMLPEKICNNVCSLMEGCDRLTLSVVMEINSRGRVVKHRIVNGVICSAHRMTYNLVEKILDGDQALTEKYKDVADMLLQMRELSVILNNKRGLRGSVDFELPESQIILDESGNVLDVRLQERLTAHKIIEEFMILTNEVVAEHMFKLSAPFVYRGHLPPTDLKLDSFTEFLMALSINWDREESVVPNDYRKLLLDIPQNLKEIVNMMALRSMTKAACFPQNKGHFGLASEFYCHFTAPIRRYPDLIIHRIIKDYISSGKKCLPKYTEAVAEASTQSSLLERNADAAEREVEDIYKARYMKGKIGEIYDGIICGVTEWGVYVRLDNTVEGLVKKEDLCGGDYFYNPVIMTLSNMNNIYKMGDGVRIRVDSVTKDKVNFLLANE